MRVGERPLESMWRLEFVRKSDLGRLEAYLQAKGPLN